MKLLLAAVALAFAAGAQAQAWPNKPIRYIVNFAPGGTTDILARLIAPKLSEALGQQVLVENRPGAGGNLGADMVAKAPNDGYTIGAGTVSSHAINVSLYSKMPYDVLRDFQPITMLATLPNMLVVHPSVPVNNVQELIAYLKANPNKLSFGSAGNGTSQHMSGELFKSMTGTQMQHIPYKGSGPMIPDLLGGTIAMSFENLTTAYPPAKQGKLKALAVTTAKRSFIAPEVPTMQEAGLAGYDIASWQALFAPAGIPKPVLDRLYTETAKALKAPDVAKRLQELGLDAGGITPEEMTARIREDIPKLEKVVRASGAKVD